MGRSILNQICVARVPLNSRLARSYQWWELLAAVAAAAVPCFFAAQPVSYYTTGSSAGHTCPACRRHPYSAPPVYSCKCCSPPPVLRVLYLRRPLEILIERSHNEYRDRPGIGVSRRRCYWNYYPVHASSDLQRLDITIACRDSTRLVRLINASSFDFFPTYLKGPRYGLAGSKLVALDTPCLRNHTAHAICSTECRHAHPPAASSGPIHSSAAG